MQFGQTIEEMDFKCFSKQNKSNMIEFMGPGGKFEPGNLKKKSFSI